MRVFLNPGHALGGDPDPGCINPALPLRECDLALTYGSLCGKYLEAAGCSVQFLQSHNLYGESPGFPCVVDAAISSSASTSTPAAAAAQKPTATTCKERAEDSPAPSKTSS